jgi:hypothetical protein
MSYPLLGKMVVGLSFTIATFFQSLNDLFLAVTRVVLSAVIVFSLNKLLAKLNPLNLGFSIAVAGAIYYLFPDPIMVFKHFVSAIHLLSVIFIPIIIGFVLNAREI